MSPGGVSSCARPGGCRPWAPGKDSLPPLRRPCSGQWAVWPDKTAARGLPGIWRRSVCLLIPSQPDWRPLTVARQEDNAVLCEAPRLGEGGELLPDRGPRGLAAAVERGHAEGRAWARAALGVEQGVVLVVSLHHRHLEVAAPVGAGVAVAARGARRTQHQSSGHTLVFPEEGGGQVEAAVRRRGHQRFAHGQHLLLLQEPARVGGEARGEPAPQELVLLEVGLQGGLGWGLQDPQCPQQGQP
uniref:Prostaglandin-H2 D-isomerase n=1 Tax=Sus scrofa TaxID=9823 RepID=A0A480IIC3_PIG